MARRRLDYTYRDQEDPRPPGWVMVGDVEAGVSRRTGEPYDLAAHAADPRSRPVLTNLADAEDATGAWGRHCRQLAEGREWERLRDLARAEGRKPPEPPRWMVERQREIWANAMREAGGVEFLARGLIEQATRVFLARSAEPAPLAQTG